MPRSSIGALAAVLALSASWARTASQEAFPSIAVPQMQLTELTGEIRIETPNRAETVAGKSLPFIRAGSLVRVLSGRAEFETDYHAVIRARKGDSFRFTAIAPAGAKPGVVRIAAATSERDTPSLMVKVGEQGFRIHRRGVLEVAGTSPGESTVRTEGGSPQIPAVEISREGALMAGARNLPPGRRLVVAVDPYPGFENAPASLASLSVVRESDSVFSVKALRYGENVQATREDRVDEAISGWPASSRRTAELMMSKYGLPDRVSSGKLVWENSSPWKETTVYRIGTMHAFPLQHEDILRQSAAYEVPREKGPELERLDIGVSVERDYKGLSAVSDSEDGNFLAVNLAVEVLKGDKTPEQARETYSRAIMLSAEGKSSPYTQGFLFQRP
ncbi:MAG: hypothetical protein HYZ75_17010 [Elusimicrobia bacterium]|nr:hypothetical protein [Elusimicrobiota bacterium]